MVGLISTWKRPRDRPLGQHAFFAPLSLCVLLMALVLASNPLAGAQTTLESLESKKLISVQMLNQALPPSIPGGNCSYDYCGVSSMFGLNSALILTTHTSYYYAYLGYIFPPRKLTGSSYFRRVAAIEPQGVLFLSTLNTSESMYDYFWNAATYSDMTMTEPETETFLNAFAGMQVVAAAVNPDTSEWWILVTVQDKSRMYWKSETNPQIGAPPLLTSSPNNCGSLLFRPPVTGSVGLFIFGCTGSVVTVPANAKIGDSYNANSATTFSVGAGLYLSAAYHPPTDLVFLGSDIGLGVACDVTTFTIQALFFLSGASGQLELTSVFLDPTTPADRPALFWGTNTGAVHRTVYSENTLQADSEVQLVPFADATNPQVIVSSVLQSPYHPDQVVANTLVRRGYHIDNSAVWSITKSICNFTTAQTCDSCTSDPYCGFCYATASCSSRETCPSTWNSTVSPCLKTITITPTSGALTGGTRVSVTGSPFNVSELANYNCRWSYTTSYVDVAPIEISPDGSIMTCVSPDFTAIAPPDNIVTLDIYWNSTGHMNSGDPVNFALYNCEAFPSANCFAKARPECGWCFAARRCTSVNACSVTGSVNPSLAFNHQYAPYTSSCSPSAASTHRSLNVTVGVVGFPAENSLLNTPGTFFCSFGPNTTLTPATPIQAFTQITSFTCPSPLDPVTNTVGDNAGADSYSIQIVTSDGDAWSNGPIDSFKFERYDCQQLPRCAACERAARPDCKWCVQEQCQYVNSATCTGSGACAIIHSLEPASKYFSDTLPTLNLNTSNVNTSLESPHCRFVGPGDVSSKTTAAINSADSVTCDLPNNGSMRIGTWTVALTEGQDGPALMDPKPFVAYSCEHSTCESCTDPLYSLCGWSLSTPGIKCDLWANIGGTAPKLGPGHSSECPIIDSITPPSIAFNASITLTFKGNFTHLSGRDLSTLACGFGPDSNPSGANFIETNIALHPPYTSLDCNDVTLPTSGNLSAYVFDTVTSHLYGRSLHLMVQSCEDVGSNCDQCLPLAGCHYCAGRCMTGQCIDATTEQTVCPAILSTRPEFIDIYGSSQIVIYGENFLNTSSAASSPIVRSTEASPLFWFCEWPPSATIPAISASTTEIVCPTAPNNAMSSGNVTLNVRLGSDAVNNVVYLSRQIPLFVCGDYFSPSCDNRCQGSTNCGWCVSSGKCLLEDRCGPVGLWLLACLSATPSSTISGLLGGNTISFDFSSSPQLPTSFNTSFFSCSFGSLTIPASAVHFDAATHTLSSVDCVSPASTQDFANDVELSVLYDSNKVIPSTPFSYIDCRTVKDCARCIATPNCGWCNKGSGVCTVNHECTGTRKDIWSNKKCPLNKVALGVGLGLGLFFLLLLLLLVAFLIHRARRRKGLVIQMKEPDYDAIAWGSDIALLYRVQDGHFSVLKACLARPEFLLQLSLALNCPATEQDSLAKALVYVACTHQHAPEMIKKVIRAEVATCLEGNTLFRSNSVASKMYKFYSRIVGIKYLYHCIARVIRELEVLGQQQEVALANPNKKKAGDNEVSLLSVTMELDTEKDIADDIDTDTNLLQLQLICQKILNVLIKTSLNNIPSPLREIFVEIDRSVTSKFPGSIDAVYKGLGGLFFLRFVCPAITAPHVYGLLPDPPCNTSQRQLVLITKVIQSIANMQPPGKKEQYMEVMGAFIESSIPRIRKFYDNLREAANIQSHSDIYERQIVVPNEVTMNGLAATQAVLAHEADKVRSWAPTSHLTPDEQRQLLTMVDECLAADRTAPKKIKRNASEKPASSKRKTRA